MIGRTVQALTGDNTYSQVVGDGLGPRSPVPVKAGTGTDWVGIDARDNVTYAVRADHTLWRWGATPDGDLYEPSQFGTDTDWAKIFLGPEDAFAIKTDGTLWAWGTNLY